MNLVLKELKDFLCMFYVSLEVEPGPCPKTSLLFLDCSSLVSASPAAAAAAKSLQSCPTLCDPITAAHQAPPSLGKGDQSWVFIGRTDVEAATPELWPPDAKS